MFENFTEDTIFVSIWFWNESFDLKYFNWDDTEVLEEYLSLIKENDWLETVNYWYGYDVEKVTDEVNEEWTLYPSQWWISEYFYVLFYDNDTKWTTLEKIYSDDDSEIDKSILEEALEKNRYSWYEYWSGGEIEELEYDEIREYLDEYGEKDNEDDEDDDDDDDDYEY